MNKQALFNQYLKNPADVSLRGDAREESFSAALEQLLKQVAEATARNHVHITTLPKPTEAGTPDFRVWNGTDRIIGYQVAEEWLKDHRERSLSLEEVRTYRRVLTALARSIEIQTDMDDLYPAVEAKPATVEWA
jgi:hypothetical protein